MSIRFHDWANKSMYIHGYVLCAFLCNNYAVIYRGNIYKILSLGMVFKAVCSSKKNNGQADSYVDESWEIHGNLFFFCNVFSQARLK